MAKLLIHWSFLTTYTSGLALTLWLHIAVAQTSSHSSLLTIKRVNSLAGRVGSLTVTTRQLVIHALIDRIYNEGSRSEDPLQFDLGQPDKINMVRQADKVLTEYAVFYEAQGFATSEVSRQELDKAWTRVSRLLKSNPQWLRLWRQIEAQESEGRLLLEKKMRAQKFMNFKVETSTVPISDKEALEYFESHKIQFEEKSFDEMKEQIKSFLSRQQVDRRLRDWLELMQSKYKIKNYLK